MTEVDYGNILRLCIYYGRYLLLQIYCGKYITADILWQIYYGRYIIYSVPQKRPYLNDFEAPEALDCCIRICLLQRTAPRTPLDRLVYKKPG